MNNIRKIIENDLDAVLPPNFKLNMKSKVLQSIQKPKFSSFFLKTERKDNILLAFGLIFFSFIIYLFGFNKSYALSIYLSKDIVFSILTKFLCGVIILVFLVSEHFEGNKKQII